MFLYLRNMCWRASLTSVAMMKSVGRYQHTDWIPWERGLEIVATAVWKTEEGWCEIMQNNNNKKKKRKERKKEMCAEPWYVLFFLNDVTGRTDSVGFESAVLLILSACFAI